MQHHISISFSTIFQFCCYFTFFFLFYSPQDTIYNLATIFDLISLQPAFNCSISIQNTIQKIFTKLQTTFQNEERHDEKIVTIFLKTLILSLYHIQVYYWQVLTSRQLRSLEGINIQVATFIGRTLTLFRVELSFFSKSKGQILDNFGQILDNFGFLLHKMIEDVLKQLDYCHSYFTYVYSVIRYLILSVVNYLSMVSISCDTRL